MKLDRKVELVKQALRSLTTHDDADAAVRHAALDHLDAFIKAEREAMDARIAEKVAAVLSQG